MQIKLPEEIIENVQKDIPLYEEVLKTMSGLILKEKISKFPIFIVHKENQINIGKPLVYAERYEAQWSVNISLIEEFVQKNLIQEGKMDDFKKIYKKPEDFACLFIVWGGKDAGFAFYPYQKNT